MLALLTAAVLLMATVDLGLPGVEAQCAVSKDPKGCYTTRYDNVNVDTVLKSDRLLRRYIDCVMDRGQCTREGLFLKEIIPDVMQTECSKCNDHQKKQAGKILGYMLQNKRDWWTELLDKFDKVGLFRKKYGIGDDDEDEDYDDEDAKD